MTSLETRSSMEAFALMREELRAEREIRGDLLAALQVIVNSDEHARKMADYLSHPDFEPLRWAVNNARAAIARARRR